MAVHDLLKNNGVVMSHSNVLIRRWYRRINNNQFGFFAVDRNVIKRKEFVRDFDDSFYVLFVSAYPDGVIDVCQTCAA